jgi:hypothetical protein
MEERIDIEETTLNLEEDDTLIRSRDGMDVV